MENLCKNCRHFVQHYYKGEKGHYKVYCGHCIYPRIKKRVPDTPACKFFDKK